MPGETEKARNIVQEAIDDLALIVERDQGAQLEASLERWKRRTHEDLRAHVSNADYLGFKQLSLRPNFSLGERINAPIERHMAFLKALEEDLAKRPERTITPPSDALPRPLGRKPIIFLSHAAPDLALAEFLEESLRKAVPGNEVFRTTRIGQIPTGSPWFQHVTDHLSGAAKFVALLTPNSHQRPWVCFEVGAAWMTRRKLVPVLGGGLTAGSVVEPLKSLQLLSLEEPQQAAQAIRELGGNLSDPREFTARAIELGRNVLEAARTAAGWEQVECDGKIFAWDGPLEELKERQGVPMPEGLPDSLRAVGLQPITVTTFDLMKQYAKGYVQVWQVDLRGYKHPVLSKDVQILLARPETK